MTQLSYRVANLRLVTPGFAYKGTLHGAIAETIRLLWTLASGTETSATGHDRAAA